MKFYLKGYCERNGWITYVARGTGPRFRSTSFIDSVIREETIGTTNSQVDNQVKL